MDSKHYLLCECNAEALLCSKYDDDEYIYVSLYSAGQFNKKPSLLERIKYCWYHLRTGKKFEDQLVLSKKTSHKLIKWLIKNTDYVHNKSGVGTD